MTDNVTKLGTAGREIRMPQNVHEATQWQKGDLVQWTFDPEKPETIVLTRVHKV